MISKDDAIALVRNTSKFAHASIVSSIMSKLAVRLGEDTAEWELVGLLHDLDHDEIGDDNSRHGVIAAERLKGRLPERCLYAIRAHDYRSSFKPQSKLDKALIAVDSAANIMEKTGEHMNHLNIGELRKKLERVSASAPWFKRNVDVCKELGLELNEFLETCLSVARSTKIAREMPDI